MLLLKVVASGYYGIETPLWYTRIKKKKLLTFYFYSYIKCIKYLILQLFYYDKFNLRLLCITLQIQQEHKNEIQLK